MLYIINIFYIFLNIGKFDPAAGLAQSGIAGTGPPEPPDDTTASAATPTTGHVSSPHSAVPTPEAKKEEPEKPKDAMDVEPSQMDITKKEDESKEGEEDGKSTTDLEAAEAKEKKDKVRHCDT